MYTYDKALARIGAVILLTVSLVYLVNLGRLVMVAQRAAGAEADLATEVSDMRTEVEALETAAADAQSDDYAERWAREERKWARQGDRPVVPVPAPMPEGTTTPTDGQDDAAPWQRLLDWLRGD